MRTTLSMHHIARIEGHGNISLSIEDGRVSDVKMNVVEPARLFESMVGGRPFTQTSYIASRICGICSSSHVITDLLAIEQIFGVKTSERTRVLRELLVYGSFLQNHAAHLFVFAAPISRGSTVLFPLRNRRRSFSMAEWLLRRWAMSCVRLLADAPFIPSHALWAVSPMSRLVTTVLPWPIKLLQRVEFCEKTVDVFAGFKVPQIETSGDFMALVENGRYCVVGDTAAFASDGARFATADYADHIEEYAVDHSAARFSRRVSTKKNITTSALARINLSWNELSQPARLAAAKAGLRPPARNPFLNNVAQAVELVDVCVRCEAMLRWLAFGEGTSEPVDFEVRAGRGVGMTEAPRGTLIHELEIGEDGRVKHASIITPTVHNLGDTESSVRTLADLLAEQGASEEEIRLEVGKLVRAYDPCLSCSVH